MGCFKELNTKPMNISIVGLRHEDIQKIQEYSSDLDSYVDGSVKDSERMHRAKSKPIELCVM